MAQSGLGSKATVGKTLATTAPGGERGTKRKFDLDQDEIERLAKEGEQEAMERTAVEQAEARRAKLPNFWLVSPSSWRRARRAPAAAGQEGRRDADRDLFTITAIPYTECDSGSNVRGQAADALQRRQARPPDQVRLPPSFAFQLSLIPCSTVSRRSPPPNSRRTRRNRPKRLASGRASAQFAARGSRTTSRRSVRLPSNLNYIIRTLTLPLLSLESLRRCRLVRAPHLCTAGTQLTHYLTPQRNLRRHALQARKGLRALRHRVPDKGRGGHRAEARGDGLRGRRAGRGEQVRPLVPGLKV